MYFLSKNPTFSLHNCTQTIIYASRFCHGIAVIQFCMQSCKFCKKIFFLPHSSNIEFEIIPVIRIAMQNVFCYVKALHVFLFSVVDVHVYL